MENSVRSIGIISLIVIGFVFISPLSVNLKQAQSQQQTQLQDNETAEGRNSKLVLNLQQLGKTDVENEIDQAFANDSRIHAKINNTQLIKNVSKDFVRAFPDMKATPQVIVAEDDLVGVLWTFNGTHKDTYLGIPATGKPVSFKMAEFMKISNGKLKEYWNAVDDADLLLDIGYLVHNNATNTTTTTNAQAQQQASIGRNNTAAELARDPGDLFLRDKATPAEELKRDPGDLLLNITADELARDPGDMLVKEKATPSEELKKDPGDLILTGPK